ncbi:MAG: SGNH/GDSL hydrolase family protein [Ferruginibacter sp.]
MNNLSRRSFLGASVALVAFSRCSDVIVEKKLLPLNSKLVLLGDSITHMGLFEACEAIPPSTIGLSFTNQGFGNLANILSGSRFLVPLNGNQGKNADTVADVLSRLNTVISLQPAVVILLIGINSIFHNVPEESIKDDYRTICERLITAGSIVIASTILPCFPGQYGELTASQEQLRQEINSFILSLPGIKSVDVEGYMNDPKCFIDGVHPNVVGVHRLASKVAPILGSLILPGKVQDTKNKLSSYIINSLFTGTKGTSMNATGVVADNWYLMANDTGGATVIVRKSPNDKKQLIQLAGFYEGKGKNLQLRSKKLTALNKDEVIEGILDIEILTACTNIATMDLLIEGLDADGKMVMAGQAFYESGHLPLQLPVGRYTLRTPPQKLAKAVASVTASIIIMFMDVEVSSGIGGTFKIYSCSITKV